MFRCNPSVSHDLFSYFIPTKLTLFTWGVMTMHAIYAYLDNLTVYISYTFCHYQTLSMLYTLGLDFFPFQQQMPPIPPTCTVPNQTKYRGMSCTIDIKCLCSPLRERIKVAARALNVIMPLYYAILPLYYTSQMWSYSNVGSDMVPTYNVADSLISRHSG